MVMCEIATLNKKYQIRNANYDTHKKVFRRGYCFICNADFIDAGDLAFSAERDDELLNSHIQDCHIHKKDVGAVADLIKAQHEQKIQVVRRCDKQRFLDKIANENLTSLGEDLWHCDICDLDYQRSDQAIQRHMDDHACDRYIKIAQRFCFANNKKDKIFQNVFRPEWHAKSDSGNWFHGGNGYVYKRFIIPSSAKSDEGGNVFCRNCGKESRNFLGVNVSGHEAALRCNYMNQHEKTCKGVKVISV